MVAIVQFYSTPMNHIFEHMFAHWWNRHRGKPAEVAGLEVGSCMSDATGHHATVRIPHAKRPEHLAILGKTGMGKSSLLRHFTEQDIDNDFGFAHIDLHGETVPYVLSLLASEEQSRLRDLSDKTIVIDPGDEERAVGINVLSTTSASRRHVLVADVVQVLKQRWQLETLGARTEELVRNAILVLSECELTLLELPPLLTNDLFRAQCLRRITNDDVRSYFSARYDAGTAAMQASWRDAVLNKVTAFTSDPHFRHLLGQTHSTISLLDAMDRGCWVLLNLDKGRLGEQAATLGSLFLTWLKNALFARRTRRVFTVYADELQNLVAYDVGIETLLSESRKFGVSICSANQFLEQYPPIIRAAIQAVGTHIFFQLSLPDADRIGAALGGGKSLQERLKNLRQRHVVVKSGHHRWVEAAIPDIRSPRTDASDLRRRSLARWTRARHEVETEIRARQFIGGGQQEVLDEWE